MNGEIPTFLGRTSAHWEELALQHSTEGNFPKAALYFGFAGAAFRFAGNPGSAQYAYDRAALYHKLAGNPDAAIAYAERSNNLDRAYRC